MRCAEAITASGRQPRFCPGAALLTDLFRRQLFLTRTPPDKEIITGIVDDVFLPLVRS